MSKLVKILKVYLKSCILMLPAILISSFIGDLITYYNYGYISHNLIEYNRIIPGTLSSGLTIAFLIYPIEKTVHIYDENIFRKNLNKALTKNKFQNLSDKDNVLIIKYNSIKKIIFGKELNISLYNDKAILNGSRANIMSICYNLIQKRDNF